MKKSMQNWENFFGHEKGTVVGRYRFNYDKDKQMMLPVKSLGADVPFLIACVNSLGKMGLLNWAMGDIGPAVKQHLEQKNIKDPKIITTATKGIQISQKFADLLNTDFITLVKENKIYLDKPVEIEGSSITSGKGKYYIEKDQLKSLEGKQIIFPDDIYSSGATAEIIMQICKMVGAEIACGAFIAKEDPFQHENSVDLAVYKSPRLTTWAGGNKDKGSKFQCFASARLPLVDKNIIESDLFVPGKEFIR